MSGHGNRDIAGGQQAHRSGDGTQWTDDPQKRQDAAADGDQCADGTKQNCRGDKLLSTLLNPVDRVVQMRGRFSDRRVDESEEFVQLRLHHLRCLVELRHHRIAAGRTLIDIGLRHAATGFVVGRERGFRLRQEPDHVGLLEGLGNPGCRGRVDREFIGEVLGLLKPVIEPVLGACCRDVGQELLHLNNVKLNVLCRANKRDRTTGDGLCHTRHVSQCDALLSLGDEGDHRPGENYGQYKRDSAGYLGSDVHERTTSRGR